MPLRRIEGLLKDVASVIQHGDNRANELMSAVHTRYARLPPGMTMQRQSATTRCMMHAAKAADKNKRSSTGKER